MRSEQIAPHKSLFLLCVHHNWACIFIFSLLFILTVLITWYAVEIPFHVCTIIHPSSFNDLICLFNQRVKKHDCYGDISKGLLENIHQSLFVRGAQSTDPRCRLFPDDMTYTCVCSLLRVIGKRQLSRSAHSTNQHPLEARIVLSNYLEYVIYEVSIKRETALNRNRDMSGSYNCLSNLFWLLTHVVLQWGVVKLEHWATPKNDWIAFDKAFLLLKSFLLNHWHQCYQMIPILTNNRLRWSTFPCRQKSIHKYNCTNQGCNGIGNQGWTGTKKTALLWLGWQHLCRVKPVVIGS